MATFASASANAVVNANNQITNQKDLNRINTDFDFEGFDGMGSFKDFAEKKGDDIFKKSSDFDVNWENF